MEFTQDKIDLIERIIKSDRKFTNNEDLYDDFFNETCKRSFNIVKTISSEVTLEAYLKKIATTAILNVLKDSGRLRRTRDGYSPIREVSIQETPTNSYTNATIYYEPADIKESPEDVMLKKDLLQFFAKSLARINNEEPEKRYLELYRMRYDSGMTQKEIAELMNISQSEVSKRLFKLMEKVKQAFN